MHASLLTRAQKRAFFRQLDALLPVPAEAPATTESVPATSTTSHAEQQPPEPEKVVGRDDCAVQSHSHTKNKMARNLPASVARGGGGAKVKASDTTQQKKKTLAQDEQDGGVLHGERVLLVPLGRDVSRKRVGVWQDMVEKLGGVATIAGESVSTGSGRSKPRKSSSSKQGATGAALDVDWSKVDIMIVSPELEADRARQFFGIAEAVAAFPPESVSSFTPEWLVYLMREHRLPESQAFTWAAAQEQEQKQREEEEKRALEQDEQQPSQKADSEGSGEDDEGSNRKNEDTRAIQRAPAVDLNTESLQRREDEMQIQKQKLVEERKVIFYQNNPGFREQAEQVAASQPGSKRLKTEAFVCQQSSCTYGSSSRDLGFQKYVYSLMCLLF